MLSQMILNANKFYCFEKYFLIVILIVICIGFPILFL